MGETAEDQYWAQLVCVTHADIPPKMLSSPKFHLGRARDCDWCVEDNKRISARHCYLHLSDDGSVWIHDTSTNGTIVNSKTKVAKGEKYRIQHGDEVHLVYKGDKHEDNFGFVFQDCKMLEEEAKNFDDESLPDIQSTYIDENTGVSEESTLPLSLPTDECVVPSTSRECVRGREMNIDQSGKNTNVIDITSTPTQSQKAVLKAAKTDSIIVDLVDDDNTGVRRKKSLGKRSSNVIVIPDSPKKKRRANDSGASEEPEVKISDKDSLGDNVENPKISGDSSDAIVENLICVICCDIFHDCISLQPCMHSFCAACYSGWMSQSKLCPTCRVAVDRVSKNHLVSNLCEAYLSKHPDKRRSPEEIDEINKRNLITKDMLYSELTRRGRGRSRGRGRLTRRTRLSRASSASSSTSSDTSVPTNQSPSITILPTIVNLRPRTYRDAPITCRQCPGYVQASSSAAATSVAPTFVCDTAQSHILCSCCGSPVPDRHDDRLIDPTIPPLSCELCYRSFCHAYWGCLKQGCSGCLAKFKDLNFGPNCLSQLILKNSHESRIFTDYLSSLSLTARDLLVICIAKMDNGEFPRPNVGPAPLSSESYICYTCGLQLFSELAYHYRRGIPDTSLPDEVTSRPDCHWGKNCRTQHSKLQHAQRFNHICEQSRT